MLRLLLGVLLLANAAFFGWTQGWLAPAFPAPHAGEREPERLALQLRPERVVLLPAPAASAAISAARAAALACLQAGPFTETELPAAESAMAQAPLPAGVWQRETLPSPPLWLLLAPRPTTPAALKARTDELQQLNLAFERLDAPPDLAGSLVLSRHASRAEAEAAQAQAQTASAPLRGLKVLALPPVPVQYRLRAAQADGEQQDRLRTLPAEALAGGFKPCSPAP